MCALLLPCTMLPCRAAAATHPLLELVTAASAVAGEFAEQPCNQASVTSTSTALRHVPASPRAPRMQARMTGRLRVERGIVFCCCDFGRMFSVPPAWCALLTRYVNQPLQHRYNLTLCCYALGCARVSRAVGWRRWRAGACPRR